MNLVVKISNEATQVGISSIHFEVIHNKKYGFKSEIYLSEKKCVHNIYIQTLVSL